MAILHLPTLTFPAQSSHTIVSWQSVTCSIFLANNQHRPTTLRDTPNINYIETVHCRLLEGFRAQSHGGGWSLGLGTRTRTPAMYTAKTLLFTQKQRMRLGQEKEDLDSAQQTYGTGQGVLHRLCSSLKGSFSSPMFLLRECSICTSRARNL